MSNRAFVGFVSVVVVAGACTGYRLSRLSRIDPSKLVNVVGLIYDLLGIVILSELVRSTENWRRLSVDTIAPAVLWLHTVFPLGTLAGAGIATICGRPSGNALAIFALLFWAYSLLPLSVLDVGVVFPPFKPLDNIESRWRVFGLYLLLSGVVLQLVAAVLGIGLELT